MVGIVTRHEQELTWPEFDRGFYEVKSVTGRTVEPVTEGVNTLSCHADTNASETGDGLAAVDADGEPATPEQPYFDYGFVCPTHDAYRDGLLEMIADVAAVNDDVRLDDVGFPRQGYCHCERCNERFEASEFDDRVRWRESVVESFVAAARDRVPGRLFLTLHPDPYPEHLPRRAGIDPARLAPLIDEFVVPLYDVQYATTYWLESLASGFQDALEKPFSVELYAVNVDVERLVHATEVAGEYADDVIYGYDAGNARAVVRRMDADRRDGETYE